MSAIRRRFAKALRHCSGGRLRRLADATARRQAGMARDRWTQTDAQCVDPRTADLPFSPAACDPRRLLRAPDSRACPRLAEPCRGGDACLRCQERQFGQQAFRRFEVLGDRRCGHPARSLSASGGSRQSGARLRSEGDFRSRSCVRRRHRTRGRRHDRSGAAGWRRLFERRQRRRQRPAGAGQEPRS